MAGFSFEKFAFPGAKIIFHGLISSKDNPFDLLVVAVT